MTAEDVLAEAGVADLLKSALREFEDTLLDMEHIHPTDAGIILATPSGLRLARQAEAGEALARLPEEAYLYWYDDQGDVPVTWCVRLSSIQRDRKVFSGPTPAAAIAAALDGGGE